jgi:dipeptidyl aminopeptidase/acylaminoacyl peptidase
VSFRSPALVIAVMAATALVGRPIPSSAVVPGANGRIVFVTDRTGESLLFTMNPDGTDQTQLTDSPGGDIEPAWSPDGTTVAFVRGGSQNDIYTVRADGSGLTDLTNTPSDDELRPTWSPDGTRIAFQGCCSDTGDEIYVMNADGSGRTDIVHSPFTIDDTPAWSPDGAKIAYTRYAGGFSTQIWTMNPDGTDQAELGDLGAGVSGWPAWSPDGSRLAVMEDYGLAIIPSTGSGGRQISTSTEVFQPTWSSDGTRILFADEVVGGDVYEVYEDGSGLKDLSALPTVTDRMPDSQPIPCTITGTAGADTLLGTPGDDVICGLEGNDRLSGAGGNDVLLGGSGNDTLRGGAGTDLLVGDAGQDDMSGDGGNDTLVSIDLFARDRVDGGLGTDACRTERPDLVRNCP